MSEEQPDRSANGPTSSQEAAASHATGSSQTVGSPQVSTELRLMLPRELINPPTRGSRRGRGALIFAILGVVVALAAGGVYVFRQTTAPPPLTPEETVKEFLSGVFLAADPGRVGAVVCESWDPVDAVSRTAKETPAGAHVSWDELSVVAKSDTKATMRARLGLRMPDDVRPSSYQQWRFSLVKERGWRVCEARPFTA